MTPPPATQHLRRLPKGRTAIILSLTFTALPVIQIHAESRAHKSGDVRSDQAVSIKVKPQSTKTVDLIHHDDSTFEYVVRRDDGQTESLTPHEYAERLYTSQDPNPGWLYRVMNIDNPIGIAWVLLGLFGQVLFACRMLVQWLTSEHQKRSVVPVEFWWLSLGGGSMLLVYFIWRQDVVGILGQATGWLIYSRNLYFIYVQRS